MKKKLLLILFIIILLPVFVFAKEKPFYKKFQTENFNTNSEFSTHSKVIELNDSYITFNHYLNPNSYNDYSITLEKYDYKGNLIGESQIKKLLLLDVTSDSNYLYLLCTSSFFSDLELKKMDYNLNIIKSYVFTEEEVEEVYYNDDYTRSESIINVKENKINILAASSVLQLNLDMTECKKNEDINVFYRLFPKTAKATNLDTVIYDSNESYQVYLKYPNRYIDTMAVEGNSNYIVLLNKNGNQLWQKKVSNNANYMIEVNDIRIVDDYIVVIENYRNYNENEYYSEIIIYDFSGNEIQKIRQNNYFNEIIPLSLGFVTSNIIGPIKGEYTCEYGAMLADNTELFKENDINPILNSHIESYCTYERHEDFYYLYYLIDSKVTGNGKIEAPLKSKAGQEVMFKAQADPSYTVKNVTVKDTSGNIINANNGSFIMPEEDVIIEAEFTTLNNPSTKNNLIGLIGIFSIIIGSYFLIKRQTLERS